MATLTIRTTAATAIARILAEVLEALPVEDQTVIRDHGAPLVAAEEGMFELSAIEVSIHVEALASWLETGPFAIAFVGPEFADAVS